jgi:ABC-2 type transport system ATP-binding protein
MSYTNDRKLAIHIENLTRDFGSVRALDNLSLEVPAGNIFGFLGPNGAGKTTTIRLLLGLLEPTSGKVEVLGFDPSKQPEKVRARTGALLEHTGVYEQMSAEDNLEFYARAWCMSTTERKARIKELLTQIGLWERRKELAGKWSKGMKQKLAVARAILHQPPLILLDEPTAGLDVMAATSLRNDLASLAANEGVTIFLTTHNMVEAERLCAQVAVIREGNLVTVGDPDVLRVKTGGHRVMIKSRGIHENMLTLLRARPEVSTVDLLGNHLEIVLHEETDTAPLVNLLVSEGVAVEEVRRGKASLEEVFVTLMEEER